MQELIIIGAGIAGISCAIYAKRANINFLIFEGGFLGGQLNLVSKIENFPGFKEISGIELVKRLKEHLEALEIEVKFEKVNSLRKPQEFFEVETNKGIYLSKSVVIATGSVEKELSVKGEKEFRGRGVSYCAFCDGYFFKDKTVGIIGGGNTALVSALYLSKIAKIVYIIHRRNEFRGFKGLVEQVVKTPNLQVIFNHTVSEIKGKEKVENLVIKDKENGVRELPVEGVFICVGRRGVSEFIDRNLIEVDEGGFIKKAKVSGIFFCGDVLSKPYRQAGLSMGEGIEGFFKAYDYLKGLK